MRAIQRWRKHGPNGGSDGRKDALPEPAKPPDQPFVVKLDTTHPRNIPIDFPLKPDPVYLAEVGSRQCALVLASPAKTVLRVTLEPHA